MRNKAAVVCIPLSTSGPAHPPSRPRKRCNLGAAILLAAVQDYRSLNEDLHKDAERFLYPRTLESQAHYNWVVSLVDELNPATGHWSRLPDLPTARHGLGLVADGPLVYAIEGGPQPGLTTSTVVQRLRLR